MALKPCKECKHEVSEKAKTCPNCGVDKPAVTALEETLQVLIGLAIVIAIGYWIFGGDDDADHTPEQNSSIQQSQYISKEMYGKKWPLSVDSGVVMCLDVNTVIFVENDRTYAVNGFAISKAKSEGYRDIKDIWLFDHKAIEERKLALMKGGSSEAEAAELASHIRVWIGPVMDTGLALCNK